MKERMGWVSNSSSSSFIVNNDNNLVKDFTDYINIEKNREYNEYMYNDICGSDSSDSEKYDGKRLLDIFLTRLSYAKHITPEQFKEYVIVDIIIDLPTYFYFYNGIPGTVSEIMKNHFDGLDKNIKRQIKTLLIKYLIRLDKIIYQIHKKHRRFNHLFENRLVENCYKDKWDSFYDGEDVKKCVEKARPYINRINKILNKTIKEFNDIIVNNMVINENTICFEIATDCGIDEMLVWLNSDNIFSKNKKLIFIGRECDILGSIGGVYRYNQGGMLCQ